MCVIISIVFSVLALNFYFEADYLNATINGIIAIFFIALLLRNIRKTIQEKQNKK